MYHFSFCSRKELVQSCSLFSAWKCPLNCTKVIALHAINLSWLCVCTALSKPLCMLVLYTKAHTFREESLLHLMMNLFNLTQGQWIKIVYLAPLATWCLITIKSNPFLWFGTMHMWATKNQVGKKSSTIFRRDWEFGLIGNRKQGLCSMLHSRCWESLWKRSLLCAWFCVMKYPGIYYLPPLGEVLQTQGSYELLPITLYGMFSDFGMLYQNLNSIWATSQTAAHQHKLLYSGRG